MRGERNIRAQINLSLHGEHRRTIFDCENRISLTDAKTVMTENGKLPNDDTVKRAYEYFGVTRGLQDRVGPGFDRQQRHAAQWLRHYDTSYNNAFWDGQQMVFGDGDQIIFYGFHQVALCHWP